MIQNTYNWISFSFSLCVLYMNFLFFKLLTGHSQNPAVNALLGLETSSSAATQRFPEMEDTPMYGQRDLILTSLNEMHHGFVQKWENGKCNF